MSAWPLKDKLCIVGIGETEYTKYGQIGRSEFVLALEAILKACQDAGLDPHELDGFAAFSNDRNEGSRLAGVLGIKQLRFCNMVWGGGGGGGAAAVHNAMMAVYTGSANYVVAFRALAQGQFGRFGQARPQPVVTGDAAHMAPFGLFTPVQRWGMYVRRHMYMYGTTSLQLGAVAVACRKHAQRNPRAVMYGRPMTLEDHQNSRMISDPFRLYDCCLETDGAAAVIITTAERAKDLKQRPVYIMGAAQGSDYRQDVGYPGKVNFEQGDFTQTAKDLWDRAGVTPKDCQVAQFYENFSGVVIQSIEDHGFCERGEGGPFVEGGRIEWPDGELPVNTSGGNLSEAYTHGFELVNEGVRQMRGTSTCQVKDAEIGLVASGPGIWVNSTMVLRR